MCIFHTPVMELESRQLFRSRNDDAILSSKFCEPNYQTNRVHRFFNRLLTLLYLIANFTDSRCRLSRRFYGETEKLNEYNYTAPRFICHLKAERFSRCSVNTLRTCLCRDIVGYIITIHSHRHRNIGTKNK